MEIKIIDFGSACSEHRPIYSYIQVMSFLDASLLSIARCAELSILTLAICYNLRGNDPIQVGKFCRNRLSRTCTGEGLGA
ncbi:hypothetical protein Syun_009615 [Stephania yunnanensis]|uniref:Uncharacterized protein n=1 Tax=Stephania yunnanensis TaxID=152371 RepID=A0AAP0KEU6_9MAGN